MSRSEIKMLWPKFAPLPKKSMPKNRKNANAKVVQKENLVNIYLKNDFYPTVEKHMEEEYVVKVKEGQIDSEGEAVIDSLIRDLHKLNLRSNLTAIIEGRQDDEILTDGLKQKMTIYAEEYIKKVDEWVKSEFIRKSILKEEEKCKKEQSVFNFTNYELDLVSPGFYNEDLSDSDAPKRKLSDFLDPKIKEKDETPKAKKRFTGHKSAEYIFNEEAQEVTENRNINPINIQEDIPNDFLLKRPWIDASIAFMGKKKYTKLIKDIKFSNYRVANWATTCFPVDKFDRRYWAVKTPTSTIVSKSAAFRTKYHMPAPTRNPKKEPEPCQICDCLIPALFSVRMFTYEYKESDDVFTKSLYSSSLRTSCYIHFRQDNAFLFKPDEKEDFEVPM